MLSQTKNTATANSQRNTPANLQPLHHLNSKYWVHDKVGLKKHDFYFIILFFKRNESIKATPNQAIWFREPPMAHTCASALAWQNIASPRDSTNPVLVLATSVWLIIPKSKGEVLTSQARTHWVPYFGQSLFILNNFYRVCFDISKDMILNVITWDVLRAFNCSNFSCYKSILIIFNNWKVQHSYEVLCFVGVILLRSRFRKHSTP